MDHFLFSLLLISYNNFSFIFEALDSIFKQTYPNIELIISDDGSLDFDKSKLDRYIKKNKTCNFSRISININKENIGTVRHLELLHTMCNGELITVLAADDAFADENALQQLADEYICNNKKIKVITSYLAMCDSSLKKIVSIFNSSSDRSLVNSDDSKRLFEELSYRCVLPSSGTAISKELFLEVGKLSDDYNLVEDWPLHARIVRMGIKIRFIDYITVLHRDGGISHGNTRVGKEAYLKYYRDLLTLFEKEILPFADLLSKPAFERAQQYHNWRKIRYKKDCDSYARSSYPKIAFYLRKGVIAKGDFALYYRVASHLSENYLFDIYCINNTNPELQKDFLSSTISFCELTPSNISDFENATFVTSFNQLFFLLEEIKSLKNAKLLLLFCHSEVFHWFEIQVSKRLFSFDSIHKLLISNNAYGFMDLSNIFAIHSNTSRNYEKRYFPMVCDNSYNTHYENTQKNISNQHINVAWFGRLDKDKIFSLINFLDNLYEEDLPYDVFFHIIGDGNGRHLIKIEKYCPKIRFIFNSYMYGEEKDNYLINNVDFVIAMGISAFETSLLGIPTIIPMLSPKPFRDDKLVYLFDTTEYCLGWNSEDLKKLGFITHRAMDIINEIYYNNNKDFIGKKCKQYAVENFSIDKHIDNIVSIITNSSLTVKKCLKNPSVRLQLLFFSIYRALRGERNYSDFLLFREKLNKFFHLPFRKRLKVIIEVLTNRTRGEK